MIKRLTVHTHSHWIYLLFRMQAMWLSVRSFWFNLSKHSTLVRGLSFDFSIQTVDCFFYYTSMSLFFLFVRLIHSSPRYYLLCANFVIFFFFFFFFGSFWVEFHGILLCLCHTTFKMTYDKICWLAFSVVRFDAGKNVLHQYQVVPVLVYAYGHIFPPIERKTNEFSAQPNRYNWIVHVLAERWFSFSIVCFSLLDLIFFSAGFFCSFFV